MYSISTTRAKKIARNINAMDMFFQYSDDPKVYRFWGGLADKLTAILKALTQVDKDLVVSFCDKEKAEYFGLV